MQWNLRSCQGILAGMGTGQPFSSLNPVYTIQPVVKPVGQPVGQQAVSRIQTSNLLSIRLYNRFDNRLYRVNGVLKPRLHDTTGCQIGFDTVGFDNRFDNRVERTAVRSTGCQTGLYNRFDNGFDNRLYRVYTNIYPVVKPVGQPV